MEEDGDRDRRVRAGMEEEMASATAGMEHGRGGGGGAASGRRHWVEPLDPRTRVCRTEDVAWIFSGAQ
nr:unnamed protein product [Digitaria exilis]